MYWLQIIALTAVCWLAPWAEACLDVNLIGCCWIERGLNVATIMKVRRLCCRRMPATVALQGGCVDTVLWHWVSNQCCLLECFAPSFWWFCDHDNQSKQRKYLSSACRASQICSASLVTVTCTRFLGDLGADDVAHQHGVEYRWRKMPSHDIRRELHCMAHQGSLNCVHVTTNDHRM